MKSREAKSSIRFRHWVMANPLRHNCTLEMKDTRGAKSLPFSALKEEQRNWAIAIEESEKGVLMRQVGGSGEPDYTYHFKQPAYVVIKFPDAFHVIRIKKLLKYIKKTTKKSLTSEEAKQISTYSV